MTENLPTTIDYQAPALSTVLGVQPVDMMNYAIKISETLTRVLREKGLTQKFGQGEHVKVEGWELAGSLLGLTTTEKSCDEQPDGSFLAVVGLQNPLSGKTLAYASGYCGTDEPTWAKKPKYARRGMANTRAIGRVYRQNFSWLIKLAGFEPTPAEEMPDHLPDIEGARSNPSRAVTPIHPTPTGEIFTRTEQQEARLTKLLKVKSLSEDIRVKVSEGMLNKHFSQTTINMIVDQILTEASKI